MTQTIAVEELKTRDALSTRPHRDITYYDRPVLKAPVWKASIPLYYFVGGAAGASFVMGAAAQWDRSGRLNGFIRRCHWVGIAGSSVGGALLIYDLGRPSRFLNMMRVFRPTSPMNMGVWILSNAAPNAVMAGLLMRRPGIWGRAGEFFGAASGVFGAALATYTGVLVANSAVPVWQESRRMLPILFGASAMASAGLILDGITKDPLDHSITSTFGTVGRLGELAAGYAMEKEASRIPEVGRPLKSGVSGVLWRAAAVLTAGSLAASVWPKPSRKSRAIATGLGLAGSLLLRFAVHYAGLASVRDPRASFRLQRA